MIDFASAEKMYKSILKLMDKNKDDIIFDISALKTQSTNHLFGLKMWEYGYNIEPKSIYNTNYQKIGEFTVISLMGAKHQRVISWEDYGKQPEDEMMLIISFPTGAYIFGEDYDGQLPLFNEMFIKLKSYNPKFVDTHNKSLYFPIAEGAKVFNDFNDIFSQYKEKNVAMKSARRIEKLKKELKDLEG